MDLLPYQLRPAYDALQMPRQRILIADAVGQLAAMRLLEGRWSDMTREEPFRDLFAVQIGET